MVFDRNTEHHIGGLANLTYDGAMLITQEPVDTSSVVSCRVELPDKVLEHDQLLFDAECVWCKRDAARGWYESGYRLTNASEQDRDILTYVMLKLMSEQPTASKV
jgi:hypothetical protein